MCEATIGAGLMRVWALLDGDPAQLERVRVVGPGYVLPGAFDVTELAAAGVAAATLAVAEFGALRNGRETPEVRIDRRDAAAAFHSEALLRAEGWQLPPVWDPIAGNYRTADGWIRLHTNYRHHRAAALRALGRPDGEGLDRDQVAERVLRFGADELEQRVVAEGGCAAAARTAPEWAEHPHGRIAIGQPAITLTRTGASAGLGSGGAPGATDPSAHVDSSARADPSDLDRPLAGIRVLDLTRVIAGPVATRTLAAWGADVLRIDPPGFAEVPAVLPDVTTGKHCAAIDLRTSEGRKMFAVLVAQADVIVHGLRPGALAGLGFDDAALRELNPALIIATHNAYGWSGPWAGRRGFDSLVQLSCGIATTSAAWASGAAPASNVSVASEASNASEPSERKPGALPVQALDHATGYLLAAGVARALTGRLQGLGPADLRGSLVGTANLLISSFARDKHQNGETSPIALDLSDRTERRETAWGPVLAVPQPGSIGGASGRWRIPAGPLGRHPPRFDVPRSSSRI
jgi:hypothetical protein